MPERRRILYVDDDAILVRLVKKALGRAGYEVVDADGRERALALAREGGFDALALDHFLREGTGLDILRGLAAAGIKAPVVYVTASSDASVAVEALKSGAADYVIKSGGEEFLALLERAIGQSIETARLRAAQVRADAEMRAARDRAEALLAEVNHRVANSLALVTSLLRLQAGASESEELKRILNTTCGRIAAIVNVHRILYAGEEVASVSLDRYLDALVADLRLTLPERVRLTLAAEPLALRPDQAVSIGVIVTELVANAAKYAYPGERGGEVRIGLRAGPDGRACVSVADDGVGLVAGAGPKGTGLGQRIVRAMAAALGSELEFESGAAAGATARVCFRPEPPAPPPGG